MDIKETINYFDRLKNDKKIRQGAIEIVYFKYVTDFKISYLESELESAIKDLTKQGPPGPK